MKTHTPFDTIDIQEKNAMICRFMGGKIKTFDLPEEPSLLNIEIWENCEVKEVNGLNSRTTLLNFHSDWNYIMQVWLKIISLDKCHLMTVKKGQISLNRLEVDKFSILLCCERWEGRKLGWNCKNIYHSYNAITNNFYDPSDCIDMKQVYYKTIIDFIEWYNGNS